MYTVHTIMKAYLSIVANAITPLARESSHFALTFRVSFRSAFASYDYPDTESNRFDLVILGDTLQLVSRMFIDDACDPCCRFVILERIEAFSLRVEVRKFVMIDSRCNFNHSQEASPLFEINKHQDCVKNPSRTRRNCNYEIK